METTNTDSIAGKMKVVTMLLPDLRKMQSAVARESAIREISMRLQISEKAIWAELQNRKESVAEQNKNTEGDLASAQETVQSAGNIESKVEKMILRILFERPDFLELIERFGGEALFGATAADVYREFRQQIQCSGRIESAAITQEKGQLLADLLMDELYITDQEKSITHALRQLKYDRLDQEYQRLSQKLTENTKMGDARNMQELQEILQKLDTIRREKKEYEASRKGE